MEHLPQRTAKQLANALRKVIFLYACGGFLVQHAMMDMEFEKVKDLVPLVEVNTAAAREHVGLIERAMRHLKEKIRATTAEFPFAWIPILVLIQTVYSCAFWIKTFLNRSEIFGFSSRDIVTGLSTDFERDCKVDILGPMWKPVWTRP